ncbi:hypothetical protein NQ318_019143, partial [Aromia moschata]
TTQVQRSCRSVVDFLYQIIMFLAIIVCVIVYGIYVKFVKPSFYWQNRQIFHVKPFSRFIKVFIRGKSFFESTIDAYNLYPDRRYYGSYQFLKPGLFVRDLDLIKRIMVKDFEHFPDHMSVINEKADSVVGLNLFSLKGEKWREMRSTLSPAFTGSKMRSMYTLMQDTAENFAEYLFKKDEEMLELEMKDIFSRFSNDVIANCAFGVKCDSLKDENNQFFTMGTTLTTPTVLVIVRTIFVNLFPKIVDILNISAFPKYIVNFFRELVKDTMAFREKEHIVRPDMIHLLMEARKGRLKHDTEKHHENDTGFATAQDSSQGKSAGKIEITDDVATAQALVFFFAGFDTMSSMLMLLSYELALNPDVQAKLHEEIDDTLARCDGRVSYEELLKMKYLDQVISETLRRYPPGYMITRLCTRDYRVEAKLENETDFVLSKGCIVSIPVSGIHMDPQYFPEPYKFNPERFSDENKRNIVSGSYMPFGSGPRNCIGSRFALLEGKALAVSLLSRFEIVPTKKTMIPIKFAKTFNIAVKDGLWLGFKRRSNKM